MSNQVRPLILFFYTLLTFGVNRYIITKLFLYSVKNSPP